MGGQPEQVKGRCMAGLDSEHPAIAGLGFGQISGPMVPEAGPEQL
jgi:hypothetical protein